MAAALICASTFVSCKNGNKGNAEFTMKVVVKDGDCLGRFVEEKRDAYVVSAQDDFEVGKTGAHVEVWKASDGKGVVYLKDFGKQKVYASPDSDSKVIGRIEYEEGYVPDTYPCLGLENGWFKIRFDDKSGYIKASLTDWDAIDSF